MEQLLKSGKQLGGFLTIGICLIVAPQSHADTIIYKWIDKDGVVSFSQNEPTEKQAREVTSITVESLPATQQRAAKRMLLHLDNTKNADLETHQRRMQKADQAIDISLKQLEKAERRLKDGSVPTGFDRVGNAGGHARLRESYFDRVSELQDDVDQARQNLSKAYTARDQLYPD